MPPLKAKAGDRAGLKRELGLRDCYFAAPLSYWNPPFEFMPLPNADEISAMTVMFKDVEAGREHTGNE